MIIGSEEKQMKMKRSRDVGRSKQAITVYY